MKMQRLSSIDNFGPPDIIQFIDESGKIIKEFISKSFKNEDLVANEKLAQEFIIKEK